MSYIGNTSTTQAFTPAVDFFNGNGSTTAFTLSRPVASVAQVQAVISNVPQKPGDAFTVSGNTITFTSAPPSGTQNIYVYYTSPITQVIAPGQNTVGTTQIQDNAITTAKIAPGAVIPADLSTGGPNWDSSGNLLIGMSSYGVTNAGASLSPTGSSSFYVAGGTAVTIGRGTSDGTAVQFNRSGTNVGTIAVATTGLTMTGTNGITFTGTQTASADANTLDDYEEGSWTPIIGGSSGQSGQSYGAASWGRYVKIGELVTLNFQVVLTTKGTISGTYAQIQGFPFTSATQGGTSGSVSYYANLNTGQYWFGFYADPGANYGYLTGNTAANTNIGYIAPAVISNTTVFIGSITFRAA